MTARQNSGEDGEGGSPRAAHFQDENDHIARFRSEGFTIIPDAIPVDLLDELQATFERLARDHPWATGVGTERLSRLAGVRTIRLTNLLNKDPVFQRAFALPPLLSFVEKLIGSQFLLQSCQTLMVGPDEPEQPLHTDDMYMTHPRPHRPFICNTIWAISDFTEENGATRFIPRSHNWPDTPRPTLAEIDENPRMMESSFAGMRKGSLLAIDGAIWHGAGRNETNERRDGLAVAYCAGWMRQQENYQLSIAPSLARTFSPELLELCGFGNYQGFVGNVDNVKPSELIMKGQL